MKKYELESVKAFNGCSIRITESPTGNWVKAKDAEKLEQQNKEILKVLKDLVQWDEIDQHSDDDMIAVLKFEAIINQAKAIITKAEEE